MIGTEILNQIRIIDRFALSAWGASEYIALQNGIQFKIRTPKYRKGVRVRITLNAQDTYDIEVYRITGVNVNVLGTMNDVYADTLVECLDSLIEDDKTVIFV